MVYFPIPYSYVLLFPHLFPYRGTPIGSCPIARNGIDYAIILDGLSEAKKRALRLADNRIARARLGPGAASIEPCGVNGTSDRGGIDIGNHRVRTGRVSISAHGFEDGAGVRRGIPRGLLGGNRVTQLATSGALANSFALRRCKNFKAILRAWCQWRVAPTGHFLIPAYNGRFEVCRTRQGDSYPEFADGYGDDVPQQIHRTSESHTQ